MMRWIMVLACGKLAVELAGEAIWHVMVGLTGNSA